MTAGQREKLIRDLDQKAKVLKRETEDANAEQEQEQGRIHRNWVRRLWRWSTSIPRTTAMR